VIAFSEEIESPNFAYETVLSSLETSFFDSQLMKKVVINNTRVIFFIIFEYIYTYKNTI
jgi:hypothetical protein